MYCLRPTSLRFPRSHFHFIPPYLSVGVFSWCPPHSAACLPARSFNFFPGASELIEHVMCPVSSIPNKPSLLDRESTHLDLAPSLIPSRPILASSHLILSHHNTSHHITSHRVAAHRIKHPVHRFRLLIHASRCPSNPFHSHLHPILTAYCLLFIRESSISTYLRSSTPY